MIVVAYLAVSPLAGMLFGGAGDPVVGDRAAGRRRSATLIAGAVALSARSSLTTWVRVSAAGLELAAQESDPVLLAWADIKHDRRYAGWARAPCWRSHRWIWTGCTR